MLRYALTRLAMALPTVLLVAVLVFVLIRLIPGDPAALLLGDMADAKTLAALRTSMGLDKDIFTQFFLWAGLVLQGDLGHSISTREPVAPLVLQRFSVSASIVFIAVILAALIAVPAGMIAAARQNSKLDLALVSGATLLMSIPSFWMGLIILLVFGLQLGWFPVIGYVSIAEDPWRGVVYIVMPIATLLIHEIGILLRMARASTLEVMRLDYITHARAKGASEASVLWRHAFPNAFAPTWTLIGLVLGNLLGGVAVVETVFTIPGLGRLLVDSIFSRDYPVIQGCLLFIALIYVLVNLLVDLCYPLFDPRVKLD